MRQTVDSGQMPHHTTTPFPKRILIVDDDPFVRRVAAAVLGEREGVEIAGVASGAEAIAAVAASKPDLILLDVMMPEMDGRATLRTLQQNGGAPTVIFLTAKNDPKETEQLRGMGALGVITKPFDPLRLPAAISELFNKNANVMAEQRKAEQLSAIAADFRCKLPVTIAGLICDLDLLRTLGWQESVAQSLLTKAHTLAGSAGLFKLNAVGEAAAHVENVVLSLLKTGTDPGPADIARVSVALSGLSEAAAVVAVVPVRENGAGCVN